MPQTRFQRGTTVATFLGISCASNTLALSRVVSLMYHLAVVIGYAVFVAEFGDKEHVFMPVRVPLPYFPWEYLIY